MRTWRTICFAFLIISILVFAVAGSARAADGPAADHPGSWRERVWDHYMFYYQLLPDVDCDLFADEFTGAWSAEEQQQARETAARLQAAFDAWIETHPELKENRPLPDYAIAEMERNHLPMNLQYAYFESYEHGGVLRSVFVYLYQDDPALAAELEQALALPGVPQPKIDRPGDPEQSAEWLNYIDHRVGYQITWEMFTGDQIHACIEQGRTPDAFTPEERTAARATLGKLRDGWRAWLAAHPELIGLECEGFPAHHSQTDGIAGVPTDYWVLLGVEDEALLAELLAALDYPEAPEPVIVNVREERERENINP